MENNKHWRSRSGRGGLQVEKVSFEQPEGSEPHVCGRRAGHGMGGGGGGAGEWNQEGRSLRPL